MNNAVLFSSKKEDWGTPNDLYKQLDNEFFFDLDAAANTENHKAPDWLGPGSKFSADALSVDWAQWGHKAIWCNPPYGRGIYAWCAKAREAGCLTPTVLLLPARTDTKWFHHFCIYGEIRFIQGRVTFEGAPAPAPFPSMIVVFRPEVQTPYKWITLR